VMAVATDKARLAHYWVASCSVLLAGLPLIGAILPGALQGGLRRTPIPWIMLGLPALPALAVAVVIWWLGHNGRLTLAVLIGALAASVGAADLKLRILPALNTRASVRSFWQQHREEVAASSCADAWVNRGSVYGLEYYANKTFGVCPEHNAPSPRVSAIQGNLKIAQGN